MLPGKRNIFQRPIDVDSSAAPGHWEGDTIIGSDLHHCVLPPVEPKYGFVIIKKLAIRTAASVPQVALEAIGEHKANFKTVTFDNGAEFPSHEALEQRFPEEYFATPYHSFERGSDENLNGIVRRYVLRKLSVAPVTRACCDDPAHKLNARPRKRHGY